MPLIESDKDLPKLLDTPSKQAKWAKKLVAAHFGSPAQFVGKPPFQGMFSRTVFLVVKNENEDQVVVQFRNEKLDVDAFKTARETLGDEVVPRCDLLDFGDDTPKDEDGNQLAWAYVMPRIPGVPWVRGVEGKGADARVAINSSLGAILGRGWLASDSKSAIESIIRPHVETILKSSLPEVDTYRTRLEAYAARLDDMGSQLPLWVSHFDLNEMNVLVDPETCKVTGLIDWELSKPLPLGVGLGRIHTIAGEFTGGEFWEPPEFEQAERAFWKEMFAAMKPDVREKLQETETAKLLQDSVLLGTLLDCFLLDDDDKTKIICNQMDYKTMPKFLSYRIPLLRGDNEPPYNVDEALN